jgi:hypothetical protein
MSPPCCSEYVGLGGVDGRRTKAAWRLAWRGKLDNKRRRHVTLTLQNGQVTLASIDNPHLPPPVRTDCVRMMHN